MKQKSNPKNSSLVREESLADETEPNGNISREDVLAGKEGGGKKETLACNTVTVIFSRCSSTPQCIVVVVG